MPATCFAQLSFRDLVTVIVLEKKSMLCEAPYYVISRASPYFISVRCKYFSQHSTFSDLPSFNEKTLFKCIKTMEKHNWKRKTKGSELNGKEHFSEINLLPFLPESSFYILQLHQNYKNSVFSPFTELPFSILSYFTSFTSFYWLYITYKSYEHRWSHSPRDAFHCTNTRYNTRLGLNV